MVEMAMFNVQRTLVTPKVGKPVTFLCVLHVGLIVPYICVKFHENILNCIYCYGVDMNDGSTGGQTDTQNFRGYNKHDTLATVCGGA